MSENNCSKCGKAYKSRSGLWKHEQKCDKDPMEHTQSSVVDEPVDTSSSVASPTPTDSNEVAEDTPTSTWMDFDLGAGEVEYTDTAPTALKMITSMKPKDRNKLTKAEEKAFKETEKAMLKMVLGGIDTVLTQYGKAVCIDPDFVVKHSESSKEMVASAQYAWMEEKGLSITKYANKGVVAGALTGWYIGAPLMRIKRDAKKPMLKRIGGGSRSLLSRIPLIGRLFKRKQPNSTDELFGNIEVEE